MTDRRPRPAVLAALLALVLAAGCGSTGPSASAAASSPSSGPLQTAAPSASAAAPSGSAQPTPAASADTSCSDATTAASFSPRPIAPDDPNAAVLGAIETSVQAIRGLTATRPVPRYTLDQAGLCAYLRKMMNTATPPELVAATERLYKQLGLLAPDASLQKEILDLMAGQVIGFYDTDTKAMYVIASSGTLGPLEQFTYAHEYDHALQDQAFDLKAVQGTATDQSDRSLARKALIEGDATLLMTLWAQKNLTPAQLMQIVNAVGPAPQAALDAAPPILRETVMWPYTQGLQLVLGAYQTSASFAGVDALWKNPPDTTEQLLHADKLASRAPAVPVSLPDGLAATLGSGWKVTIEDTFGELQLGILARTGDAGAGTDPAVGWGGDRVSLLEGPGGGRAAVVQVVFDTTQAAGDFSAKLQPLAAKLNAAGLHATVAMPSDNAVTLVSADSAATLGRLAGPLKLTP